MANTYASNEFRTGLRILHNDIPHIILEHKFTKPGKGQAFTKVKLKNLLNGSVLEQTYKTGEVVPAADVMELTLQFLYYSDAQWVFMDSSSFEQYTLNEAIMNDIKDWLKPEDVCTVTLHNNNPIGIELPHFVEIAVSETDPGVKGDTVSGGSKPAVLETGATLRVPLFIEIGDVLRIDTRSREYVSRAK